MKELDFEEIKKENNFTDEELYAWAERVLGMSRLDVDFYMALESGEIEGDVIELPNPQTA